MKKQWRRAEIHLLYGNRPKGKLARITPEQKIKWLDSWSAKRPDLYCKLSNGQIHQVLIAEPPEHSVLRKSFKRPIDLYYSIRWYDTGTLP